MNNEALEALLKFAVNAGAKLALEKANVKLSDDALSEIVSLLWPDLQERIGQIDGMTFKVVD